MKKILLASVSVAALSLTACQGATVIPDSIEVRTMDNNVISVNSSEEVKVEPDIAQVVYGVYTENPDAGVCQSQNAEKVSRVVEQLKGLGVDEKSIQTSGYQLNPNYSWENDKQTTIGYQMTTQITVSDLPIADIGTILSQSVEEGINTIESVAYMSSQYDEKYQEALKLAIESAGKKAAAMAEAGACSISGISHVEEFQADQEARYRNTVAGTMKESVAYDTAMPVMPGEINIIAQVRVDFKINN